MVEKGSEMPGPPSLQAASPRSKPPQAPLGTDQQQFGIPKTRTTGEPSQPRQARQPAQTEDQREMNRQDEVLK